MSTLSVCLEVHSIALKRSRSKIAEIFKIKTQDRLFEIKTTFTYNSKTTLTYKSKTAFLEKEVDFKKRFSSEYKFFQVGKIYLYFFDFSDLCKYHCIINVAASKIVLKAWS